VNVVAFAEVLVPVHIAGAVPDEVVLTVTILVVRTIPLTKVLNTYTPGSDMVILTVAFEIVPVSKVALVFSYTTLDAAGENTLTVAVPLNVELMFARKGVPAVIVEGSDRFKLCEAFFTSTTANPIP